MPKRYLSETVFANARARAQQSPEGKAAEAALREAAEKALSTEPHSVRDNGGSPYFRVDAVYVGGQDGVVNEEGNRESSGLAKRTGQRAVDLAMAYRYFGEERYAEHALRLIHTWCINENTYMFPGGHVEDAWNHGAIYGGDICVLTGFRDLFFATYLLDDYPGWDLRPHAAVWRWIRRMVDAQRPLKFFQGVEMYNNWEDERLLYLALGALALHDLELLDYVFTRWGEILPMKMTDEGELPRETHRTRSMTYSLMALHASAHVAEIAHAHGFDLFNLTVNGKSLKLAVDYVTRYLLDLESWPHQMIHPLRPGDSLGGRLALFEMAHTQWGDPAYLEVINSYGGRPVTGEHATLLQLGM